MTWIFQKLEYNHIINSIFVLFVCRVPCVCVCIVEAVKQTASADLLAIFYFCSVRSRRALNWRRSTCRNRKANGTEHRNRNSEAWNKKRIRKKVWYRHACKQAKKRKYIEQINGECEWIWNTLCAHLLCSSKRNMDDNLLNERFWHSAFTQLCLCVCVYLIMLLTNQTHWWIWIKARKWPNAFPIDKFNSNGWTKVFTFVICWNIIIIIINLAKFKQNNNDTKFSTDC